MADNENQFNAELEAKVPEEERCELVRMYNIMGAITGSNMDAELDHLVEKHASLYAAEFGLALMRFIVGASDRERQLFGAHDVKSPRRFGEQGNGEEILVLEKMITAMRTEAAIIEGAGRVRH